MQMNEPLLFSKFNFKIKRKPSGEVEKYKARWVICENSQRPGLDFEDASSGVLGKAPLRFLFCLAVKKKPLQRTVGCNNSIPQQRNRPPHDRESARGGRLCARYNPPTTPRHLRAAAGRTLMEPADQGLPSVYWVQPLQGWPQCVQQEWSLPVGLRRWFPVLLEIFGDQRKTLRRN